MRSKTECHTVHACCDKTAYSDKDMAERRQAFNTNPELQRFVLADVRHTGKQLGVGSYGSVEELEVNGVTCAGKRLHDVLVEQGNSGVPNIVRKYLQECQVTLLKTKYVSGYRQS